MKNSEKKIKNLLIFLFYFFFVANLRIAKFLGTTELCVCETSCVILVKHPSSIPIKMISEI